MIKRISYPHIACNSRMLCLIALGILLFFNRPVAAQQWALYNTRTLFDAFENPSQKTFQPDTSRKYAFNFFIPNGGATFLGSGPAEGTIRKILYRGVLDAKQTNFSSSKQNRLLFAQNTYVFMFRAFNSIQYNRELGFSWQIKSDLDYKITNETFGIFHNYTYLDPGLSLDIFNNRGKGQSYHQFSISYRENYNRRLAFGAKLGYLSGIAYSKLSVKESKIDIDEENKRFEANLKGDYKTNFLYDNFDNKLFLPGFKNPGAALTLSANYRTRRGLFILANLKDIGFIHWTKHAVTYNLDQKILLESALNNAGGRLRAEIDSTILQNPNTSKFTSLINTKAEILLHKDFNFYKPNLILSKSLLNSVGHIALVNTFQWKLANLSITPAYNLRNQFQLGGQLLIKSPNFEFFVGSDQLFKTFSTAKGISNQDSSGNGYPAASGYIGIALKFGPLLERRSTSGTIPGVANLENENFFKKIFKGRSKRR